MKDENLNAKIELWKETNSYANKIEESYPLFYTLLITILGVVITVFSGDLIPQKVLDVKFVILIFLPISISAIIGYLAYNFRWVAIARMFATTIENEINRDLNENVFVWNSRVVDEFLAKRNFINTKFLPIINVLFFVFTDAFLNYSMIASSLNTWIKIVYFVFTAVLFIMCSTPFFANGSIRKFNFVLEKNAIADSTQTKNNKA